MFLPRAFATRCPPKNAGEMPEALPETVGRNGLWRLQSKGDASSRTWEVLTRDGDKESTLEEDATVEDVLVKYVLNHDVLVPWRETQTVKRYPP